MDRTALIEEIQSALQLADTALLAFEASENENSDEGNEDTIADVRQALDNAVSASDDLVP